MSEYGCLWILRFALNLARQSEAIEKLFPPAGCEWRSISPLVTTLVQPHDVPFEAGHKPRAFRCQMDCFAPSVLEILTRPDQSQLL